MTQCDRCGFDPAEWNEQDATRTLAHAELLLDLWSADAPTGLATRLSGRRADVTSAIAATPDLIEQAHHLWHGLVSIADQRRLADDTPATITGQVAGLHRSDGGVPKSPVDAVTVGVRGVEGDRQATRLHHGRPWQALCLWSAEVIDALAADGHPIGPGSAGENITVAGIDWASLRAGAILDIGEVRCQLWAPAVPCSKLAGWFSDGRVDRIHHDNAPDRTRWYASVVAPGSVALGDAVVVSP